eukprot:398498-Amphidinium_carterae.1
MSCHQHKPTPENDDPENDDPNFDDPKKDDTNNDDPINDGPKKDDPKNFPGIDQECNSYCNEGAETRMFKGRCREQDVPQPPKHYKSRHLRGRAESRMLINSRQNNVSKVKTLRAMMLSEHIACNAASKSWRTQLH